MSSWAAAAGVQCVADGPCVAALPLVRQARAAVPPPSLVLPRRSVHRRCQPRRAAGARGSRRGSACRVPAAVCGGAAAAAQLRWPRTRRAQTQRRQRAAATATMSGSWMRTPSWLHGGAACLTPRRAALHLCIRAVRRLADRLARRGRADERGCAPSARRGQQRLRLERLREMAGVGSKPRAQARRCSRSSAALWCARRGGPSAARLRPARPRRLMLRHGAAPARRSTAFRVRPARRGVGQAEAARTRARKGPACLVLLLPPHHVFPSDPHPRGCLLSRSDPLAAGRDLCAAHTVLPSHRGDPRPRTLTPHPLHPP